MLENEQANCLVRLKILVPIWPVDQILVERLERNFVGAGGC